MRYGIGSLDCSPHDLLVGLALETEDHADGVRCTLMTVEANDIVLDDGTVFEVGQTAGQLSAGTRALISAGLWRRGADIQTLRAFLANGSPTNADALAALKALIRSVASLSRR